MTIESHIEQFISSLTKSITSNTFVKVSLGNYQGKEQDLKNIYIRKVLIKREDKLAFTFRYKTKDIVKNYAADEGIHLVKEYLLTGFKTSVLFTTESDLVFEQLRNLKSSLKQKEPSAKELPSAGHDKEKKRLIKPESGSYLYDLKITDEKGEVFKNAQDKYKQINHYVEILSSLIKEVPGTQLKKAVDMGSGKGYLTFALYDYLHNVLKLNTEITGVEYRQDMVDLCNRIAGKSGFNQLSFVQGTIEEFESEHINLLIALHACDTATDDAIYKGIRAGAELIVVAPCCHKQIRREIEKNKAENELNFLTKYGIFLERQAEMVTDGIRALILEYFGYKTKVFEFISDAHTPKNVLVVGIKTKERDDKKAGILKKIQETKTYFGIDYHHLERLLKLS